MFLFLFFASSFVKASWQGKHVSQFQQDFFLFIKALFFLLLGEIADLEVRHCNCRKSGLSGFCFNFTQMFP